jgi:hypothetical protein
VVPAMLTEKSVRQYLFSFPAGLLKSDKCNSMTLLWVKLINLSVSLLGQFLEKNRLRAVNIKMSRKCGCFARTH